MRTTRCTRDQIMDAAEQLFGSRGYANVTINQICEASGLPVGSVYHHFGSKSGVLRSTLERGLTEFFGALPTSDQLTGSPVERLAAHYEAAADLIVKRLQLFRLFSSLQLHQAESDEVQAILNENRQRGAAWMQAFIEPVARSCGVRDAAEHAKELAELNLVIVTGLVTCAESITIDLRAGISHHLYRLILASIMERAVDSAVSP